MHELSMVSSLKGVIYTYGDETDTSQKSIVTLQDTFLKLPFHEQKKWRRKKFLDNEVFMENLEKGMFSRDEIWRDAFGKGKDKYFIVSVKRPFLNKESARNVLVTFKKTHWIQLYRLQDQSRTLDVYTPNSYYY